MNAQMRNIAGLFADSRSRLMIILTLSILGISIAIAVLKLHGSNKNTGPTAQVSVAKGPGGSLESIPFNTQQTPEYRRLQEQQNALKAKTAVKTGSSAIPTIVGASEFDKPVATATPDTAPPQPVITPAPEANANIVPASVNTNAAARKPRTQQPPPPVQNQQNRSQIQSAMANQANQLFAAWGATPQAYVPGDMDKNAEAAQAAQLASAQQAAKQPLTKAGNIMFAVLVTAVNSDEPGPIMAKIVEGQFKGAILLGNLVYQTEKVMLTFNVLNLPDKAKTIPISAVAIDQDTARTSLSSDTDHHYLLRYGSLFASSFMQGYGQTVANAGATTTTSGLNTTTTMPSLTPKQEIFAALGTVGQRFGDVTSKVFEKRPTVYVNSGTALGILFMQDVVPVEQQ
jgi:type IV secretory pathway VirB10-like protein